MDATDRTIRVVISWTLRDMHAERDYDLAQGHDPCPAAVSIPAATKQEGPDCSGPVCFVAIAEDAIRGTSGAAGRDPAAPNREA